MQGKAGRGEERGRPGRGRLPQPEPREPPRIPAPPWTAHSAVGRAAERRAAERWERGRCAGAHALAGGPWSLPEDLRARLLEAGVGMGEPEPKAEELALRQGVWDEGGEGRLHKKKAALDPGDRREAEAQENCDRRARKKKPGSEGGGGGGLRAT